MCNLICTDGSGSRLTKKYFIIQQEVLPSNHASPLVRFDHVISERDAVNIRNTRNTEVVNTSCFQLKFFSYQDWVILDSQLPQLNNIYGSISSLFCIISELPTLLVMKVI